MEIDYSKIKVIGFDADDTLWVNESYYRESEKYFAELLSEYLPAEEVNEILFQTEMQNLEIYGYGAKAFVLSLLEAALKITKNKLPPLITSKILDLGKDLINKPVVLLEGVQTVLAELKKKGHKMVVATKGDLLDQERKLAKSNIEEFFHHVEVMSDKKEVNYSQLLSHLEIKPSEFLMIGNSLKSDIIPVLNIGGNAIHVPFPDTWEYENNVEIKDSHKFEVAEDLTEVLKMI